MSVSYSLGRVFRLKPSQRFVRFRFPSCGALADESISCRSFGVAAAMFMNSNSLPIALMQSLVVTVPGLKWDEDDTKSAMLGRALTYLVLYSTLGMVVSVQSIFLSHLSPRRSSLLLPQPDRSTRKIATPYPTFNFYLISTLGLAV